MNLRKISYNIFRSSLLKNSFVYVLTDGINSAIPFVLLPFISRYLTPTDYGIVSNYNVLIQILSVFVYLATVGMIPVMFFKTDKEDLKIYISNMIALDTMVSGICIFLLLLFSDSVDKGLGIPFIFQLLAVLSVWFTSVSYLNLTLWRCEEAPLKFGAFQISQTLINALTTILFVIALLMSWQGRVYSMLISSGIMGILSIYVLYKRGFLRIKLSKRHMNKITWFGLPLIPHALSFWLKSGANKVLLSNMCGLEDNGLYSVAMNWGAVVALFTTAFSNAYSPWLFQKLANIDKNQNDTRSEQTMIVKLIWIFLVILFLFVGIVYVASYFLTFVVFPESYYRSLDYLPMIMVEQAFTGGYLLFVCFCHYTLNTKGLGAITFSLSLIQVFISYLLINIIGPIGVAYSSALVSMFTFAFIMLYAMHVYRLPWFKLKLIRKCNE